MTHTLDHLPTAPGDRMPKNTGERLQSIHDVLGFYPQSQRELSLVSSAMGPYWQGVLPDTSLSAGFLQNVLWHQYLATTADQPNMAVVRILRQAEGYANDTRGTTTAMRLLSEALEDEEGQTYLADSFNLSGWSDQPMTKRGLAHANRLLTIDKIVQSMAEGIETKANLDHLAKDVSIEEMMEAAMVFEVRAKAELTPEEQEKRRAFWVDLIEKASHHDRDAISRPAKFALRRLDPSFQPQTA